MSYVWHEITIVISAIPCVTQGTVSATAADSFLVHDTTGTRSRNYGNLYFDMNDIYYRKILHHTHRAGDGENNEKYGELAIPKRIYDLWVAKGCDHVRITVSKDHKLIVEAV